MYWALQRGEIYYDKLIWALAMTTRCSIHHVSLVNHCPHCGVQQLAYHARAGMTSCAKCLKSLVQEPSTWVRNTKPAFGEKDCVALVKAIADGTLRNSVAKAFSLFVRESLSLGAPMLAFRHDEAFNLEMRTWRRAIKPTLSTMIKRCYLSGVSLVDVLADPKGAAHSAGQLIANDVDLPSLVKPRQSEKVLAEARRRLLEVLSSLPKQGLVSFPEFARSLGVSKGFLIYREPVLSKVYIEETSKAKTNWSII